MAFWSDVTFDYCSFKLVGVTYVIGFMVNQIELYNVFSFVDSVKILLGYFGP